MRLLRLAIQAVLFFLLLGAVVGFAASETGALEKRVLVASAALGVVHRRNSSPATSICSGLGDDPPIAEGVVDHRPRHLRPAGSEGLVQHHDVDRYPDVTGHAAQPNRLADPILDDRSITRKSRSLSKPSSHERRNR